MATDQFRTGTPFFLPIAVPFTGVAAEKVEAQSGDPFATIDILGMVTDLAAAQAKVTKDSGRTKIFSDGYIPLPTFCAVVDAGDPASGFWRSPLRLSAGDRMDFDLLNTNGDGPGSIVGIAEQVNAQQYALPNPGRREVLIVDSGFAAADAANAIGDPVPTERNSFDFILEGFYTTLTQAAIRIIDADGLFWMRQFTPVWALAGQLSYDWKILRLQQPYFVGAQKQVQVEFQNVAGGAVEPSGKIFLIGHRPKGQ